MNLETYCNNDNSIDEHSELVDYDHKLICRTPIIIHDAPAGAGKTHAFSKMAVRLANAGENVLFVQPTMKLIGATLSKLDAVNSSVIIKRIDTESSEHAVIDIMAHMKLAHEGGQILFITHAAHQILPYFHRRDTWHVLMDEAPQAHQSEALNFRYTHDALTSLLVERPVDDVWSELVINDTNAASDLRARAKVDDGLKLFKGVLNLLTSDHWSTYVQTDSYSKLLNGSGDGKSAAMVFAALKPSFCEGYKSFRIAGAHISDSILVKLWKAQGAKLQFETLDGLQYNDHSSCERVRIFYGINNDWSKYLRQKYDKQVWEPLISKSASLFEDNLFLFLANKSEKTVFNDNNSAIRLPNFPHGLNQYDHINGIAFLPALNPHPQHHAFLKFLGLSPEEIRRDVYYSKAYQAIMRGGIRKHDGTAIQTIVVPDQGLAEWLQTIFQGSSVEWLGIELPEDAKRHVGRPRIHENNSTKSAAYRDRLSSIDYISLYQSLLDQFPAASIELEVNNSCYETLSISKDKITRFHATLWDNTKSKFHSGYVISSSTDYFVQFLKHKHLNRFHNKEDNNLLGLGLALYDVNGMRKSDRFLCANGIMLDNDGGGMTPDEFANFMPGLEMFVFNTFSSTPESPRWRVYIPTSTIMPAECYKRIVTRIFTSLDNAGFHQHGFDTPKKSASDLMYLPCQAAHPEGSFFIEYRGPTRSPLHPMSWINFDDAPEELMQLVEMSGSARGSHGPQIEADFQEDLLRWRTEGNLPGKRNPGWSTLYFALISKGIRFDRIRDIMSEEAQRCSHSRDRKDRLAQLERLMKGRKR